MDIEIKVSYGDRVMTLEVSEMAVYADGKISAAQLDRFMAATFLQARAMVLAGEKGDTK